MWLKLIAVLMLIVLFFLPFWLLGKFTTASLVVYYWLYSSMFYTFIGFINE